MEQEGHGQVVGPTHADQAKPEVRVGGCIRPGARPAAGAFGPTCDPSDSERAEFSGTP
jgi:hypothetical protein